MADDAYVVAVDGLKQLEDLDELESRIVTRVRQAINTTARRYRAESAREMRDQVAFPARYLSGENGRLRVGRYASNDRLQAVIQGRDRPTSLARFSKDRNPAAARRRGGVRVSVEPGSSVMMEGAFLMNLRNGNLGLAIRTKDGKKPRNAYRPKNIAGTNIWLLYGPSVDQVFRGVAEDVRPDAADFLEREFFRLLEL